MREDELEQVLSRCGPLISGFVPFEKDGLEQVNGCCIFMDHILVHGETKEQHNKNLAEVFKSLKDFNVTLNDNIWVFSASSEDAEEVNPMISHSSCTVVSASSAPEPSSS